eukprot:TRINITY_DN47410_c0_g1_i1.p1 TRINITY_DN47410_c0_g1~~TRINITY_DN47410_c0_g1_i1.p1  ORF type:complete len:970 (-),score=185.91 TRINITY_DN47410_c0_g1_i1:30-2939(-)
MVRALPRPNRVPVHQRALSACAPQATPTLLRPRRGDGRKRPADRQVAPLQNEEDVDSEDADLVDMIDLEEGATDCRVVYTLLRTTKLHGVLPGLEGEGLVQTKVAGYGWGVPPCARVEHCIVIPLGENEVRYEGNSSVVLSVANDGINLTWWPSLSKIQFPDLGPHRKPDDDALQDEMGGWANARILPFVSVFSRYRGLVAGSEANRQTHFKAPKGTPDAASVAAAVRYVRQSGMDGLEALVMLLARLFGNPRAVISVLDMNKSGSLSLSEFDTGLSAILGTGPDIQTITGLKFRELFQELNDRGTITLDSLTGCCPEAWQTHSKDRDEERRNVVKNRWHRALSSTTSPARRQLTAGQKSFAQLVTTVSPPRVHSAHGQASSQGGGGGGGGGGGDEGIKAARAQASRRAEAIRRESEVREVQDVHLDPERERFITTVSHTTILHPLDFGVSQRAFQQIEEKHRLTREMNAKAEACFAKKRGALDTAAFEESEEGSNARPQGLASLSATAALNATVKEETAWKSTSNATGLEGGIPNTPRALLNVIRSRNSRQNGPKVTKQTSDSATAGAFTTSTRSSQLPPGVSILPANTTLRHRVDITASAVDLERPRVAVGVGDGQIALYFLFRAQGQRKKQLHQIQGFDASRRRGDVVTTLFLPSRKLEEDGSLAFETVLAGFESGRVAVFKTFLPDDFARDLLQSKEGDGEGEMLEALLGDRERAQNLAYGEPVLEVKEPLLLEHYECHHPVVGLFWHPIMGIFSISSYGQVLVVDINGVTNFSINEACGRNATVTAADLSLELEQLAVAGERGVFLWQNLSQAKFGVIGKSDATSDENPRASSPVVLVKYLPSTRFLLTVHREFGEVKIWDARSTELRSSTKTVDCLYATSAFFDRQWNTLYVFGPSSVAEIQLVEEERVNAPRTPKDKATNEAVKVWRRWQPSKAQDGSKAKLPGKSKLNRDTQGYVEEKAEL